MNTYLIWRGVSKENKVCPMNNQERLNNIDTYGCIIYYPTASLIYLHDKIGRVYL